MSQCFYTRFNYEYPPPKCPGLADTFYCYCGYKKEYVDKRESVFRGRWGIKREPSAARDSGGEEFKKAR